MAQVAPMTLEDILKEIHTLFSNGIDYPAEGEEDYDVRVALINNVIRTWENTPGMDWHELYDVKTGQTIATAGDSTFACDASFREMGGVVKLILGSATLEVPIYSLERLDDDTLPETYCFITGKPGAYILNFVGVTAEWVGATIRYRFRRFATKLTETTDVADMRNPNYIIFSVVSRLFQLARNNTGYTIYFNDAEQAMEDMQTNNIELQTNEVEEPVAFRLQGGVTGQ